MSDRPTGLNLAVSVCVCVFVYLLISLYVDKSPKVYTQLAREGVVLTQDSDNI